MKNFVPSGSFISPKESLGAILVFVGIFVLTGLLVWAIFF